MNDDKSYKQKAEKRHNKIDISIRSCETMIFQIYGCVQCEFIHICESINNKKVPVKKKTNGTQKPNFF